MATLKGTNKNDTITGSIKDDYIYGLDGNDRLDGGLGNDDIVAGNGSDLIVGRWEGSDAIDGGSGVDTLDYSGITETDSPSGLVVNLKSKGLEVVKGANVDVVRHVENLIGTKFDDEVFSNISGHVFGGNGADTIHIIGGVARGDAGEDTLFGDFSLAQIDTFWLQRGKGADFITDFESSQDILWLSQSEFALGPLVGYSELVTRSSGHAANGTRAQLIFDTSTHELYYDADGIGTKGATLIADFEFSDAPNWYDFEMV